MKKILLLSLVVLSVCNTETKKTDTKESATILEVDTYISISRDKYKDQLYGFWLGQCIANWTGLVTEMDKIGNIGEIKTGDFYTRADWGKPDQPSIWGEGVPSDLSPPQLLLDYQNPILRVLQFLWFFLNHLLHKTDLPSLLQSLFPLQSSHCNTSFRGNIVSVFLFDLISVVNRISGLLPWDPRLVQFL